MFFSPVVQVSVASSTPAFVTVTSFGKPIIDIELCEDKDMTLGKVHHFSTIFL